MIGAVHWAEVAIMISISAHDHDSNHSLYVAQNLDLLLRQGRIEIIPQARVLWSLVGPFLRPKFPRCRQFRMLRRWAACGFQLVCTGTRYFFESTFPRVFRLTSKRVEPESKVYPLPLSIFESFPVPPLLNQAEFFWYMFGVVFVMVPSQLRMLARRTAIWGAFALVVA